MQKKLKEVKSKVVSLDLIDRYDEARMHLDAFLDGIYNTSISGNDERTNAETITVLCSLATRKVREMNKILEEITKGNGGRHEKR